MNDHRKSVQPDCENDPAIDRNMWAGEDHNASEQPEDYEYMRARNYENIVPGVKGEVPTLELLNMTARVIIKVYMKTITCTWHY